MCEYKYKYKYKYKDKDKYKYQQSNKIPNVFTCSKMLD